jgi:hypothetical protein
MSKSIRAFTRLAVLLLLASFGAAELPAQAFVYTLNGTGHVSVNATLLGRLASHYKPQAIPGKSVADERWVSGSVDGSDLYAIRLDGRVNMNGERLYNLQFNEEEFYQWVDLVVTQSGSVWALRSDGRLSRDGALASKISKGDHVFVDLSTDGTDVYTLRSDGAVYVNAQTTKLFSFKAGQHQGNGEGDSGATTWDSLEADSPDGLLYGLRRDGSVVRGDPADPVRRGGEGDPPEGEIVAKLPFGDNANSATIYVSFSFGVDGRWWVVRGSGRVYNSDDFVNEVINLPGDPADDFEEMMVQIVAGMSGDDFLCLRVDGRLYDELGEPLVNLTKQNYCCMAISTTAPDLTKFKNGKPKVSVYGVKAVTGRPLSFPVLVTDTDKISEDLIVTVDAGTMPPGSTWDAMTRTFRWDSPGPAGSYRFKITVDDGVAKPVKKAYKINVKDLLIDAGTKNKAPQASKVTGTQVLASVDFELPILVRDLDGDEVTVSVDQTQEPFTLGATFDQETLVVSWPDPPLVSIGDYTLQFTLDDGTVTRAFKVKLKLVSSILEL